MTRRDALREALYALEDDRAMLADDDEPTDHLDAAIGVIRAMLEEMDR